MGNPSNIKLADFTRSYYARRFPGGMRFEKSIDLRPLALELRNDALSAGVRPVSLASSEQIEQGLYKLIRWNVCTKKMFEKEISVSREVFENVLRGSILRPEVMPGHLNHIPYFALDENIKASLLQSVSSALDGDRTPWAIPAFFVEGPLNDLFIGSAAGNQRYNFYQARKTVTFRGLGLKESENAYFIPYRSSLGLSYTVLNDAADVIAKYRFDLMEQDTLSGHDHSYDRKLDEEFLNANQGFYSQKIRKFFNEIEGFLEAPQYAGWIPEMKFRLNGPKDHFEFIVPNSSQDIKELRLIPNSSITLGPLSMKRNVTYEFHVYAGSYPDGPGNTMRIDVKPKDVDRNLRSFFYQPEDMMFVRER